MSAPEWSYTRLGLRRWLVSGLGLGYMPVASGTFGSLVASALALAVWGGFMVTGASLRYLDVAWVLLMLLACVGCVAFGKWACAYYAHRCRPGKDHDPGVVVIDELAGQWLSLIGLAMPNLPRALTVLGVQFVLFRIFDVLKPPPCRRLEKLPFGWGILLDDLAAAIYANLIGQVIFRVIL
jgi:phosphatidylglycerophosphatase A